MGYKYHIDTETGLLTYTRYGVVLPEELMPSLVELFSDPDFQKVEKVLVDLSTADFSKVSHDELFEHGDFSKRHLKDGEIRVALAAPKDLAFGMARVYEAFASEGDNLRVFRTLDEAKEWLDHPGKFEE